MPRYDYRCKDCRTKFTVRYESYDDVDDDTPECPNCGSETLSKLIGRVGYAMGEEARMERLADPSRLSGLDEDDPRAMGRLMRDMASEMGEDLGPEFNEVVGRLESGESADSIESSMDLDGAFGGDDFA